MEIEFDEILKEGVGEEVNIHFHLSDDSTFTESPTALVSLQGSSKEYDHGRGQTTDGFVRLSDSMSKSRLCGQEQIKTASGLHDVNHVSLTIRGGEYQVDSIDDPAHGMIKVHVSQLDKQHTSHLDLL